MISKDLKKLNDIRAKQFKTKLLYLGDEFQLPPVKEDRHSEVFDTVDVKYTLTEVIRQKDNTCPQNIILVHPYLLSDLLSQLEESLLFVAVSPS